MPVKFLNYHDNPYTHTHAHTPALLCFQMLEGGGKGKGRMEYRSQLIY